VRCCTTVTVTVGDDESLGGMWHSRGPVAYGLSRKTLCHSLKKLIC